MTTTPTADEPTEPAPGEAGDPFDSLVTPAPDDGTAESPRRPLAILLISLAVVAAILAAGFGIASAAGGGDSKEASLRKAAGQVGQALLTYDYNDPQAH